MLCFLLCSLSSFVSITIYTWFDQRCWWPTLYTQFTTITVPHNNHLVPLRWCWRVFPVRRSYKVPVMVWILFSIIQKKKGRVRRWSLTVYTASDQTFTGMLQYLQEIILWLKTTWLKYYLVRIAKLPKWPCQPSCSYMKQILQLCWTLQLII